MLSPIITLLFLAHSGIAQQQDSLPVRLPQVAIEGRNDGTCPSAEATEQAQNSTKEEICSILRETVVPILSIRGRCPCGGPGVWRRIAHLNMSDLNQQCPPNWQLITTPERGCSQSLSGQPACRSAVFPSHGSSYSRVCGQVNAVQRGTPDAFHNTIDGRNPDGLEGVYVDGVSLTHGAAGSRQHIWTFAAAIYETHASYVPRLNCRCTNTNFNWPFQTPSFVGNNYFCDTGNPGPQFLDGRYYLDDSLWDGDGCGPTNTCCQFNNPPWFCTTLPQPTTDDIELRICSDQPFDSEDVTVQLVDIYVL